MNKYREKKKTLSALRMPSRGFSAVELLVTLFIAFLFLSIGYTLFGTIVTMSSQNRHRAQADNIALEYLRRYESTVASTCAVATPVNGVNVTGAAASDLPGAKVTVGITCPNSTLASVSLVKVTITYQEGGSQRNVYHEVYASI